MTPITPAFPVTRLRRMRRTPALRALARQHLRAVVFFYAVSLSGGS